MEEINGVIFSDHWNNIWLPMVIGVTSSISASFLLYFGITRRLKPKMEIAKNICYLTDNQMCLFKFINKSRYTAYDVQIRAYSVRLIDGGRSLKRTLLETTRTIPLVMSKNKSDKQDQHAFRIKCKEDIKGKFADNNADFIQLTLIAKHGLSGIKADFYNNYYPEHVINGTFAKGDDCSVIP